MAQSLRKCTDLVLWRMESRVCRGPSCCLVHIRLQQGSGGYLCISNCCLLRNGNAANLCSLFFLLSGTKVLSQ